jgi:PKD repeat protein
MLSMSMFTLAFNIKSVKSIETPPAVPPAVEWNKTYGRAYDTNDYDTVVRTRDGGYAIASTADFGTSDADECFYLVKTDSNGTVEWNKTYGTVRSMVYSMVQTNDGGYILAGAGATLPYGVVWVVKTDTNGNMQWNKTYGGNGDNARSIIQTADGGYAIAGIAAGANGNWEGFLIKTDSNGNMLWRKIYGASTNNTQLESVVQTSDGGFIMAGATQSPPFSGKVNAYLVRTDSNGTTIWTKEFSQTMGDDYGRSVIQTSDGGYAIAGQTDFFGSGDAWLIKTNATGGLMWDMTYSGSAGADFAYSIVQTMDGGYAMAGTTDFNGNGEAWIIKTDSGGILSWNLTYGGSGYSRGYSVIQTSDGGYALAGYTNMFSGNGSYQVWLIRLAPPTHQANPPIAEFNWFPLLPIGGESVTFNASSSSPGWNGTYEMPIVQYTWAFGDGNKTTGQTVTHAYASPGNYTVTLNVTDSQGLWNVKQQQIEVGQPHGPIAEFSATPTTANLGEAVEFNASASLPGWNGTYTMPITQYRWDFGDGNTTMTTNPFIVHACASAGEFNVTLTVSDSQGLNSSSSTIIVVVMPTFISISTSASTTLVGFAVDINGTLSDSYGNSIGDQTVVLYYTFPGVYSWFPISSGVTDNLGRYNIEWIPTATGYFTIKAVWAGNATYSETSVTTTLSSLAYNNQYVFSVESNSTISALAFNTTDQTLSFTASGPGGTKGYTRVTIAKSLVANATNIRVYLDGNQLNYSIASTDDSWLLTFNYTHSTHKVAVNLNAAAVPEFASITFLPLFMMLIVLSAVIALALRRRNKTQS